MDILVKLTSKEIDIPKDTCVIVPEPQGVESPFKWGLEQAKSIYDKIDVAKTGPVTLWIDPDPIQIGMAFFIQARMNARFRSANIVVQVQEEGWVIQPFLVEGSDTQLPEIKAVLL